MISTESLDDVSSGVRLHGFLASCRATNSPARACFRLVDDGLVTLLISAEILTEVRDILARPKTLHRFPQLTTVAIDAFLRNVLSKATSISDVPRVFTLQRDPKDEAYVNLALAGDARYLVSRDGDLLDLMRDASFRHSYPGLEILDPMEFLRAVTVNRPSD